MTWSPSAVLASSSWSTAIAKTTSPWQIDTPTGLDVHARVGELETKRGRLTGLVRDLDLKRWPLGELHARALQGGADRRLVAGGEQDGAMVSSRHTGQLEVDAPLRTDVSEVRELARLVLQLDTKQVHRDLPFADDPHVLGSYSGVEAS